MTNRSIWVRIGDAYIIARDFYREVKLDLHCIIRDDYRGAVVLVAVAFWIGFLAKGWVG